MYNYIEKDLIVRSCKTRSQIRRILISEFLKERQGKGKGEQD